MGISARQPTVAEGQLSVEEEAQPEESRSARTSLIGELLVLLFLGVVYDLVLNTANLRTDSAVRHAHVIVALEGHLHIFREQVINAWFAPHALAAKVASVYYDFGHETVTFAVLAGLWWKRSPTYRRARKVLLASNLVALAIFFAWPTAPPRLYPGLGFTDVVTLSNTPGAWNAGSAAVSHANEYGSLPSLHVAWALWVVLVAWQSKRVRWRLFSAAHLAITATIVIVTGNHYFLDVFAGAVLVLGAWLTFGSDLLLRRSTDR